MLVDFSSHFNGVNEDLFKRDFPTLHPNLCLIDCLF